MRPPRRVTSVTVALLGLGLTAGRVAAQPAPVPCLIEPHQSIKLAAPVSGLLDQVAVDRGDVVTKGMLVAHLLSAQEEADLASAKVKAADESAVAEKAARRDFTESKRASMERLKASSQFVSRTAVEEADSDAKQAAAALQTAITQSKLNQIEAVHAAAKLSERSIRSPVNGIVTERTLSAGEYAYEQTHIVTIAEMDPLNVELYMPVARYGEVTPGMSLEVRPEAPVGGRYQAKVAVIDQVFDARSATFGVRLSLPNPGLKLPANIRCEVAFTPR
jgi:membrane fusion protein (multidrug efflux system)